MATTPYELPLACLVLWQVHTILGKCVDLNIFDMALFALLWSVWALQMCLFMIILRVFVNIDKYCVVVILRPNVFDVHRLFVYFTKACAQKSPYFSLFSNNSVMRPSIDLGRSARASF